MSRPLRIFGYARVSSEAQADGSSLGDQQDAITRWTKATHGTTVTRMFTEAESSLREKIELREQIQTLMGEVRRGDLVLCDKIDRWSRDPEFTYASVRQILAAGASFYAVGDQCDPSTAEGDTMLNFRVLFAREEHKRIKQRMVGTRKLLRDRGYYSEGLPPWGYRRAHPKGYKGAEKNVLIVDEAAAKLVRRAFQLCIQGQSLSEIASAIGVKVDRVKDALHNRHYLGEVKDSSGAWIKGKHPAVVDADTFRRAQDAVAGRRHGFRPGAESETSTWILREIARCAHCGARMAAAYAGPHETRRHYYRCSHRCGNAHTRATTGRYVPVRDVEAAAEPLIVARLEQLREDLAREPKADKAKPSSDLEERRSRLARRRERYLEAFADEQMDRDELRAAMAKLDAERLKLDAAEQAAKKTSPLATAGVRRTVLRKVGAIRRAWSRATPLEKRAIVGHLAHEARVAAGKAPAFKWRSAEELAEET